MSKESFESLNEYQTYNVDYLVPEKLMEAGDDDEGAFGKIIDRGMSFIPRAMRFKKAKKVMRKSLSKFTNKAKNLVSKFASGFKAKVNTIDKEYKALLKDKIEPLIEDNKMPEAIEMMESQKKELEAYKKDQIAILDKGIEDILGAYTTSIDKRIDNPGFVLNVELSEKGKGELKAKWQELAAVQKIEIDKEKTKLISSPGWKRLEEMIAEMTGFIKTKKKSSQDITFFVQDIDKLPDDDYLVRVHVRVEGGRPQLQEKGLIVGEDPEKLDFGSNARKIKVTGTYQYNLNPYKLRVNAPPTYYVRPYLILKDADPMYGDVATLDVKARTKEEKERGDERIIPKGGGGLEDEERTIPSENKK